MELIPRTEEGLTSDLDLVKSKIPNIDIINIPDLLRFEIRSWQGAALA